MVYRETMSTSGAAGQEGSRKRQDEGNGDLKVEGVLEEEVVHALHLQGSDGLEELDFGLTTVLGLARVLFSELDLPYWGESGGCRETAQCEGE